MSSCQLQYLHFRCYTWRFCMRRFSIALYLFTLSTMISYNPDFVCSSILMSSLLESPKEAWILIDTQRSLNCTFTGDAAIHWEKDGIKISSIDSQSLKEIAVNKKTVMLQFVNATLNDAGIYYCTAKFGMGKTLNSSSVVHVGDLPAYKKYKCKYHFLDNSVQILPEVQRSKEINHLDLSYCISNSLNRFCTLHSTWHKAKCNMKEMSCSFSPKRSSVYRLHISLGNKYGQSRYEENLRFPKKSCVDKPPTIQDISVINGNQFSIIWKLHTGTFARLSLFDYATNKKIYEKVEPGKKVSLKIKDLRQCTMYKICIEEVFTKKSSCLNKSTENKKIANMEDLKFSENIVKKTLDFYWTDPSINGDISSRIFFYVCRVFLDGSNDTITTSINDTKLSIPLSSSASSSVVFAVKLCTPCGCGDYLMKEFQLSRNQEPNSEPRKTQQAKELNKTYLIAGVSSCLILLLLGAVVYLVWRSRKRSLSMHENEYDHYATFPEDPIPLAPQQSPPYEEVAEVEGLYDQVEEDSSSDNTSM